MAVIFTNQTSAYDGSGSPITGSATLPIAYRCTPPKGGILQLYARPNGSNQSYILLWDAKEPTIKRFEATSFQYYYVWTPKESNAVANLEG